MSGCICTKCLAVQNVFHRSIQNVIHRVVIKIRQLFLQLLLLEIGVGANNCKWSQEHLSLFLFVFFSFFWVLFFLEIRFDFVLPKNRYCIYLCFFAGVRFARVQSMACLAKLLPVYRVEPTANTRRRLTYTGKRYTLCSDRGIPIKFVPRY
jgi:hypothetical protein